MPASRWKWLVVASFVIGAIPLSSRLGKLSDGDDAREFYNGGMRPWSEVLTLVFVPPGMFEVPDVPKEIGLAPPKEPVFVHQRWRPFAFYGLTKILWELGLSPDQYRIINWVFCWLCALGFGWGAWRALALAFPADKSVMWVAALLFWWCPPVLFTSASPFYFLHLPFGLGGAAIGLSTCLGKGRTRWIKIAAAIICSFLAFQTHENGWWMLTWYGVWLALLRWRGLLSKPNSPRFWWPFALVAAHVLTFRTLIPGGASTSFFGSNVYGFDWAWLRISGSYFFLVLINGLAEPLSKLSGATSEWSADVAELPSLIPTLATLAGMALILIPYFREKPKNKAALVLRRTWMLMIVALVGMALVSGVPYWITRVLARLLHYTMTSYVLLILVLVGTWAQLKKRHALPILLLAFGSAFASWHYLTHWNWLDVNVAWSEAFTSAALKREDLKECTSDKPCCLQMSSRVWGRTEWNLSWNAGAAKHPPFIPDGWPAGWPGPECARRVFID